MTKQEVIGKAQKLFQLAGSSNEHEAALAAAKARMLLAKHNLTMAEVPSREIPGLVSVIEASTTAGRVLRNWVKGLLIHVAEAFECEHVIRRRKGCAPVLTFIGAAADAEIALYTFRFLMRELERLADEAVPRLKRKSRGWSATALRYAYLDGAMKRISERLKERASQARETEQRCCTELVLAKRHMIRNYMQHEFGNVKMEYGRTRSVSATAFREGYTDAEKVSLLTPIGEDSSTDCARSG